MNRAYACLSRINSQHALQANQKRKARTRTLIQAGGLLNLCGLLQICEIEEGDDLQADMQSRDKAAVLLGILRDAALRVSDPFDTNQMEKFKKSGINLLKQSAAKTYY